MDKLAASEQMFCERVPVTATICDGSRVGCRYLRAFSLSNNLLPRSRRARTRAARFAAPQVRRRILPTAIPVSPQCAASCLRMMAASPRSLCD